MTRLLALLLCLVISAPALAAKGKVLDVQVIKAPPGAEAWLVEDHTVPVISMSFSFEGGIAYDPDDKPGVGRLISTLLDEGAGDMKSQEYQGKLEENAISMSYTAGRDAFYGSVVTLSANRALAFDLLALALNKPRFDQDAIERMKNANSAQIRKDLGDPSWLVARTFNGMLFEGHYYARPGFGTLDSMNAITRKDLQDFVAAQFARNVLKIAIAGDISKADAEKAVESVFGPLREKAEPVELPDVQPGYGGKIIMLPLDTPQTFISAGENGIKRSDKDWHAATVMNSILGGSGFDARLMKEIRAKRGLTYGVYSALSNMKYAGVIQANMSASNDKVEEALRLLKESWEEMAKDGPTVEEFQNAKSYLTGALALELTSTGDIASIMNSFQRDGLGPDYINKRNGIINALTMDDIKRVAARLLKADQLAIVLVGKPRNINVDILLDKPPGMGGDGKTP
ncbi:MAG: insulinase family protein [Alphaproteobacteria bacterium]|nr:MAG: insulinase family protein [Alphaproteobacteria bacterium]